MADELFFLSLSETADRIKRREISPIEITQAALDRIDQLDPLLNAFITVTRERALQQAKQAEDEIMKGGYRGPLHGIPYSLKDLVETSGERTTAGSPILSKSVPAQDSAVYRRLAQSGAILIGKNNMLEFAYGSPHPEFGLTRNPWNIEYSASGSSSGSAAAVAVGIGYGSIGSDTAGSIRIPAAWTGLVGIKPTNGRVSLRGIIPLAASLDTVGPLTRSVRDAALLLGAIAGFDPEDPYSVDVPVPDYLSEIDRQPVNIRVGIDAGILDSEVDAEISAAVTKVVETLQKLGMGVKSVRLPDYGPLRTAAATVLLVEASEYHRGWMQEQPDSYSYAVRKRLLQGLEVRGVDYVVAQHLRFSGRMEFLKLFEEVDVLITPTSIINPMTLEEVRAEMKLPPDDPVRRRTRFTSPMNLIGLPALSAPAGQSAAGLPIGVQIIGRPFEEGTLFAVASCLEAATGSNQKHPHL